MSKELVVAIYNEDFGWIPSALETGKVDRVWVYNKGTRDVSFKDERIRVLKVANLGREGETFLRHIIENWADIPEGIWFAQGNPFEHSPDFVSLLAAADSYSRLPYWSLSHRFKESASVPPNHLVDINNAHNIGGLRCATYLIRNMQLVGHCSFLDQGICGVMNQFRNRYRTSDAFGYLSTRLGITRPSPITEFGYAACFYTQGACIRRHPRWVYEEAKKFLLESNTQGHYQGYILERYWPYLLTGRSYDSLADAYRDLLEGCKIGIWNSFRKRFWCKRVGWDDIVECRDSVACFFDGKYVRRLPGINVQGRDTPSPPC